MHNHLAKKKKKWCQAELSISKGIAKLVIALGKMADLENSEPASYEIKRCYCVPGTSSSDGDIAKLPFQCVVSKAEL